MTTIRAVIFCIGSLSLAEPAAGACLSDATGRILCTGHTTTREASNRNAAVTASDAQTYIFTNGRPIDAAIAPFATIDGAGLALVDTAAKGPVSLTNAGNVNVARARSGAVELTSGPADLTYRGNGAITNSAGTGLIATSSGNIHLTTDGAITAGLPDGSRDDRGRTDTPPGLLATEQGHGNILIDGAGAVLAPAGRGLIADQSAPKGRGGIEVAGSGDVAGMGAICPGVPDPAEAIARGKTGCSGIRATIDSPRNASNIVVTRSGNISGTSTAINAITAGNGNIFVQTGDGAHLRGDSEFGIEAKSHGSGSITVVTDPNGSVTSGGNGIFAANNANAVAASARSAIVVRAAGTIKSGTFPLARLNGKNPTGTLGGISAGYVGGAQSASAPTVFGRVVISSDAAITAQSGTGILGYNFGAGSIAITDSGTIVAQVGSGITTRALLGPTRIDVTAGTTTGVGTGQAGLDAQSIAGAVHVSIAAGASITGTGGAVGAKLGGPHATIFNAGTVSGRVGVAGENVRIFNAGTISGEDYSIDLTGGLNEIAGPGRITNGINVSKSAIFQPGLGGVAVGTPLIIDGPLRFSAGATYRVRLAAHAADLTATTGTAAIKGATLEMVTGGHAPMEGRSSTILAATRGIAGRFGTVTSDLAFLAPQLTYRSDTLVLTTQYTFRPISGSANEMAVGSALDGAAAASATSRLPTALRQVRAGLGAAVLDQLSGEGLTAAQNVAQRSAASFTSAIFDQATFFGAGNSIVLVEPPVRELGDPPAHAIEPSAPAGAVRTWSVWASGFGGVEDIRGDATSGAAAQANTIYGGVLGVDHQFLPNHRVGIAVGGSDGRFDVPARTTSGSTAGGHIALYDIATFGALYGAVSTSFSVFDNRTTRMVDGLGGGGETERGAFGSQEVQTRFEVGRHFDRFGGVLTPFLNMDVASLHSNGFQETSASGPGLALLAVERQYTASAPATIGARFQNVFGLAPGVLLSPSLQVAYVHEFAPYRLQTASLANLPGAVFLVDGARPARNAAQLKAGATLAIGMRTALFAALDSEVSRADRLYVGKAGVALAW